MQTLAERLHARGAALVGYADLSEVWRDVRHDLPRGISIAVAIKAEVIAGIEHGPTVEYYAEYNRANALLDELADYTADHLQVMGYRAEAIPSTVAFVDPGSCAAPFQHKTVATRAGLGWIGKCALLITREYGSAIRLASVLTDAPVPIAQPVNASACGDCTACVEACPGHAITGANWTVGMFRDQLYDAFACRETALRLAGEVGVNRTICGVCINVCPWTRQYLARAQGGIEGHAHA